MLVCGLIEFDFKGKLIMSFNEALTIVIQYLEAIKNGKNVLRTSKIDAAYSVLNRVNKRVA